MLLTLDESGCHDYCTKNNNTRVKCFNGEMDVSNVVICDNEILVTETNSSRDFLLSVDNDEVVHDDEVIVRFLAWNIHGLGDKLEERCMYEYISKYDIIIFLETMKLDNYSVNVNGYIYKHFQRKFQHPRAKKASGGIGILIRSDLSHCGTVSVVKNSDFAVWLRIKQGHQFRQDIYVAGVYIPPIDSSSNLNNFSNDNVFHLLQDDVTYFSKMGSVTLCGDFNARIGSKSDIDFSYGKDFNISLVLQESSLDFPCWERYSEDVKSNCYGNDLLALCKSSGLKVMNGYFKNNESTGTFTCYTSQGKSMIDYLICDQTSYKSLEDFILLPLSPESDHRPLDFSLKISKVRNLNMDVCITDTGETVNRGEVLKCSRYVFDLEKMQDYKTTLKNPICQALLEKIDDNVISGHTVDDVVQSVYTFIETAISLNFRRKFSKSINNTFPKNKWFDDECKKMKHLVNSFSKTANMSIPSMFSRFQELRKIYKRTIQCKKRQYQEKVRQQLESFASSGRHVKYWEQWNSFCRNNKVMVETHLKIDDFVHYFDVLKNPPESSVHQFDLEFLNEIQIALSSIEIDNAIEKFPTDQPISFSEVRHQLIKLKSGKAPGIDGIGNEFFKYACDELIEPLTTVFNYIWQNRVFPDKWSEGIIQPIHKKGSTEQVDNYRKVTLMASMGKIFEAILNQRLTFQCEAFQIEDPNQFGFCRDRRTSDNIFIIDTLISYQRSKKKSIFVSFIDFTKAFDFVNRDFLYYKLLKMGFGGNLLTLIISLFSKARSKVRWEGQLGRDIDSIYGVLQGGIISPKLFNLFISDIDEYLETECGISVLGNNYTHLVYADDLVLLSDTAEKMQQQLDNLKTYCRKWHLLVNVSKSKVMVFNNRYKNAVDNDMSFQFNGDEIEIVKSFKYLGHLLCNSRNIHALVHESLATKAQHAMHVLKSNIKFSVGFLSPWLAIRMFDSYVTPILDYNSEIWCTGREQTEIEKIQLKFLKNMLNVRQQTPSFSVLADTGRFPLCIKQKVAAMKYWYRLYTKTCPSILKQCFDIQLVMHRSGQKCWLDNISNIIRQTDINIDLLDIPQTISVTQLTEKLYTHEMNRILNEIGDETKNPKLRTYKLFKNEYRIEPYLILNLPKAVQKAIARFRMSSHNLSIEVGRHKRPYLPRNERICEKCNLKLVEDEFHCLMVCPKWDGIRKTLIEVVMTGIESFLVLSVQQQFIKILENKTYDVNKALGDFLKVALHT